MDTNIMGSQTDTTKDAYQTRDDRARSVEEAGEHEYGAEDCYEDCMRLFRNEERERPECAKACGIDAS